MRVFVTGGTGLIGSAVVAELLGHGHTVLALARSGSSAAVLETEGAESIRGELADLGTLRAGAAKADGVIHLASRGVRSAAVRMPRTVHNEGRGGFAGLLTDMARRTGVSGYPGAGAQRWPAVHALDAAVLFRLVLEKAPAGTAWHAVSDQGDAVRDIATVIGRRLGLPVEAVSQETFGPLGPIFATDQPSTSTHTRQALGWEPRQLSLLEDLENIQP